MVQSSNMSQVKITIRPKSSWYLLDLHELWMFRELFFIFAWRDIKVRYKQTFVGVGWVVFQPLVNTVIFTIFFGNFAKIPSGSLPYPLFVLLGLIFWTFFSTSLSHAANSFIENTAILGKVYFPREILPLSSIAVGMVDFMVSTVLFIIVAIFYHVQFSLAFLAMVLIGLLITIISSSGLGLLLASINVKYRDVRYILPYFLQMMIFVTPVIYPLGIMRPSFQTIVSLNPMAGVIDGLRSSLVTGQIVNSSALTLAFVSSIGLFLLGIIYFRKTQAFFADLL
jgi:lipopolysaccharide transport system permease protein